MKDHRRLLVASLILRKRTQREIVDALYKQGLRNPETGNPYSIGTINSDVQALRKEWKESAAKDMAEAVADHLAELGEVRRSAWGSLDYGAILRALGQEAEIRGINSASEIKLSGGVDIATHSFEEDLAIVREIIASTEGGDEKANQL
jgi:hypothetical protein